MTTELYINAIRDLECVLGTLQSQSAMATPYENIVLSVALKSTADTIRLLNELLDAKRCPDSLVNFNG